MAENNSAPAPRPPRVEAAALSAAFVTAIRRAGLSTSPDRAARLAEALHLIPPAQLEQLYWTCRVVLVSAREQVPLFDAVFAAVFRGFAAPAQPGEPGRPGSAAARSGCTDPTRRAGRPGAWHRPRHAPPAACGLPGPRRVRGARPRRAGGRPCHGVRGRTPARDILRRALARRSGGGSSAGSGAAAGDAAAPEPPHAHVGAQHRAPGRPGDSARRPAVRYGRPRLLYARRREQRRKLVLLCDVSGSMEPYARVFVSLLAGRGGRGRGRSLRLLHAG